jgi:hypothetical protein
MFIAALFTIAKAWNQLRCLLADKWILKRWCLYIYSALKKNEVLSIEAKWMELEDIMSMK